MKIALGADHRGYKKKEEIKAMLEAEGHKLTDVGTFNPEPCDYPEIAARVAEFVSKGEAERGILICKSGIGMAIAANKFKGTRAALCHDLATALLSRQHNDANILVLGSEDLQGSFENVIRKWLAETFEGERHARRVAQISEIENAQFK